MRFKKLNIQELLELSKDVKDNEALSFDLSQVLTIQENTLIPFEMAVPALTRKDLEGDHVFALSRPTLCLFRVTQGDFSRIGTSVAEFFASEDHEEPFFSDYFLTSEIFFPVAWCYLNSEVDENGILKPLPLENVESSNGHIVAFCKEPDLNGFGTPYYTLVFKDKETLEKIDRTEIYATMPLPDFDHLDAIKHHGVIIEINE